MFCADCGNKVFDGGQFCPYCGGTKFTRDKARFIPTRYAPINAKRVPPAETVSHPLAMGKKFCADCGGSVPRGDEACPRCGGTNLAAESETAVFSEEPLAVEDVGSPMEAKQSTPAPAAQAAPPAVRRRVCRQCGWKLGRADETCPWCGSTDFDGAK